jgi:pimeloyl-ACP methyl ester carboxylesterase
MKLFLSMLIASTALAADFPDPASLPANPTLPDPLVMRDGTRVTTKEAWLKKRAPELRDLFQHYMYGTRPATPEFVKGKVLREDKAALGGKATLREVSVDCGLAEPVHLLVVIPNSAKQPCPAFLGMNFNGNYQLLDDPQVSLPRWSRAKKAGEPNVPDPAGRGREKETWALEQSIDRGYAVATFYSGDVVPDDKELAEKALKQFRKTEAVRGPADTATIMAWSWGFSRMLDYLLTVPEIDGKRVAVVGHSRNGKTALVTAAFDERVALAIPTQAGSGGTGPSRVAPEMAKLNDKGRPTAETVAVINNAFPHWFCGNFKAFNEAVEKLPFDQHELIALCAPRPVMLSNASEDLWANPDGQYALLKAAAPVYALFGHELKLPAERPAIDEPLNERLGYYIRPGKHSMTSGDWKVWLDFADKWLK